MLYRHSLLVLKHIPKHPQFREPENKKAFRLLSKRVDSVLKDLEALKPEIESVYAEWERTKPATQQAPEASPPGSYDHHAARDPSLGGYTQVLDASEHQDLAVDLAQQELRRRDTARRATKQAGLSDQETSARRRAGLWDSVGPGNPGLRDELDLQRQLEATRRNLDRPSQSSTFIDREQDTVPTTSNYHYPSIARQRHQDDSDWYSRNAESPVNQGPPIPSKSSLGPAGGYGAPAPPPKYSMPLVPPPIPSKLLSGANGGEQASPAAEAPVLPRKERLTFRPGAYLENGEPIRSVFLPAQLRHQFLKLAEENTRAGLEMCGILCGMPINNALFVRCLLIPDQKCTSDTCETQNESAMFDYCDKEDLLMIGWIHTHPTQTCFMSSRDLHTHAGYQIMMPESIAIVCAPKFTPS